MSGEMVSCEAIRWTLRPQRRLELLPTAFLTTLDLVDLCDYTHRLQLELQAVRALVHESCTALRHVTVDRDRARVDRDLARATNQQLREQLASQRTEPTR